MDHCESLSQKLRVVVNGSILLPHARLVRLRLDCMAPVRRWEDYAARQGLIARAGAGLVRYVVDGVTRGTGKPAATRRRRECRTGTSKLAAVGERT